MELKDVKTVSMTKQISAVGETFDIKEARVTLYENKISTASGNLYDKEGSYAGSFNYNENGETSISSKLSETKLAVEDIETFVELVNAGSQA